MRSGKKLQQYLKAHPALYQWCKATGNLQTRRLTWTLDRRSLAKFVETKATIGSSEKPTKRKKGKVEQIALLKEARPSLQMFQLRDGMTVKLPKTSPTAGRRVPGTPEI